MHCLSNFKAQIEYESIDFNADKIKQHDTVRKAMNWASLKISSLSLQIRFLLAEKYAAKDRFRFSSIILWAVTITKKLKIERRQKAKLREKQCAYFHDSCSRGHFDSPETARCFIFGAEGNISARAEVSHVIATKFQPGQPG